MAIADALGEITVSELDLTRYVAAGPSDAVKETVQAMRDSNLAIACVVSDDELVGIFTQRDVLMRVIGRRQVCDHPIGEEMTVTVRTMRADQTVADGLTIMRQWWVRSVPVLDGDGHLVGSLSWYTVMKTIAELLGQPTDPTTTEPAVEDGVEFVDFTGLNTSPPILVTADDTADIAVHHLRTRAMGSVLVADQRGHVTGIVTEFDVLAKLGCERDDLTSMSVAELMTPDPVTLSARSPVIEAIRQMAKRNFSHAPLMGETGRPVSVASFRDIVSYLDASLESLG